MTPNKVQPTAVFTSLIAHRAIGVYVPAIRINIVQWSITWKTFFENALIKAESLWKIVQKPVIADDSGICVDALDGKPGIYSARYEGVDTPYSIKNQIIIDRLAGVEGEARSARFVCAIAAALPDGRILETKGTIEGVIGYEERGENGFGYDPIFYLPEYGCYSAELSPEKKNSISHRGNALEAMKMCQINII